MEERDVSQREEGYGKIKLPLLDTIYPYKFHTLRGAICLMALGRHTTGLPSLPLQPHNKPYYLMIKLRSNNSI